MTVQQKSSTLINIFLWIAQLLLAATFLWSAFMKLFKPEELPFPWIKDNPGLVTVTSVADLLAGLGLTLPALLRIQPKLTIWTAYGIIFLMLSAIAFHISRDEASQIGFSIFVMFVAAFIAWGRQTKAPIR